MIWFNLVIPLIAILVMLVFFRKRMAWWEYILIFAIPCMGIAIAKFSSVHSQTTDTEFWNSHIVNAQYVEEWETWDYETCTREVCSGSGKDRSCHSESYDCSHCDEYGPSWTAYNNLGQSINISQQKFEEFTKIWNNRVFADQNRHIINHWGCGKDGDAYVTETDGVFEHIQPYSASMTYENKVQCSKSVFNFQEVDSADIKDFSLFEYNLNYNGFNYNPIFGWPDRDASKRLSQWNGLLGRSKKIHMLILVFFDKPYEAAMAQESYWKGGNKNEFILCIGLNKNKEIGWTKVISWTEVDRLKLDVERTVLTMPFNLSAIVDTMASYTKKDFVKKSFKDFSYLTVEPTQRAIFICFIVTLVLTIGLCVFSVLNPFNEDGVEGEFGNRRRF